MTLRALAAWIIRAYQLTLGLALGPRCRYQPTCSNYAHTAITRFGLIKGGLLAARRIGRCHPWGGSGYDPVPEEDGIKPEVQDCCLQKR